MCNDQGTILIPLAIQLLIMLPLPRWLEYSLGPHFPNCKLLIYPERAFHEMSRDVTGSKGFRSHLTILKLSRAAWWKRMIITLIKSLWLSSFSAALIYSFEYKWVFSENYRMGNTTERVAAGSMIWDAVSNNIEFLELLALQSPVPCSLNHEPRWPSHRKPCVLLWE